MCCQKVSSKQPDPRSNIQIARFSSSQIRQGVARGCVRVRVARESFSSRSIITGNKGKYMQIELNRPHLSPDNTHDLLLSLSCARKREAAAAAAAMQKNWPTRRAVRVYFRLRNPGRKESFLTPIINAFHYSSDERDFCASSAPFTPRVAALLPPRPPDRVEREQISLSPKWTTEERIRVSGL